MNVFLTGASGYIGSSVLRALFAHGHRVTAVVRSDQKGAAVRDAGGDAIVGDLLIGTDDRRDPVPVGEECAED